MILYVTGPDRACSVISAPIGSSPLFLLKGKPQCFKHDK
uniref:Uncharacterized protein n=1 Tax=Anguilla anguilla TaxID=7936 RepID=A0A0E9UHD3_ANGAN